MLSHRRRTLLTLASYGEINYTNTNFANVYFNLLPNTFDGTHFRAKLSKIYANGVIENQLVQNGNFSENSGWFSISSTYTLSISNDIATATKIASGSTLICYKSNSDVPLLTNRKYFCFAQIKPSSNCNLRFRASTGGNYKSMTANIWNVLTDFINSGSSLSGIYCGIEEVDGLLSIDDTVQIKNIQYIDLTLMFGTGNEPTTLTDNRIQSILNGGYRAYNTGSYKCSEVGEIIAEPYNLLSLERTQGDTTGWNGSNTAQRTFDETKYYVGFAVNNYLRPNNVSNVSVSSNSVSFQISQFGYGVGFPIRVIGGKQYTLTFSSNVYSVGWYDKDGNYISNTNDSSNVTAPSNAYWALIVFTSNTLNTLETFTDICFHLTGTRTGYAPHTAEQILSLPNKIALDGAISAKNTFEITESAYVFTRNVWKVDISSMSWNYETFVGINLFRSDSLVGKIATHSSDFNTSNWTICSKYNSIGGKALTSSDNKTLSTRPWGTDGNILIVDTTYTTTSDFVTANSGTYLYYELATPRVITIPRKHLGSYTFTGNESVTYANGRFYIFISNYVSDIKLASIGTMSNMYMNDFITVDEWDEMPNAIFSNNGLLFFYVPSISQVSDLQALIKGKTIWFETNNEVADPLDTIKLEQGGTIATDSSVLCDLDIKLPIKQ